MFELLYLCNHRAVPDVLFLAESPFLQPLQELIPLQLLAPDIEFAKLLQDLFPRLLLSQLELQDIGLRMEQEIGVRLFLEPF